MNTPHIGERTNPLMTGLICACKDDYACHGVDGCAECGCTKSRDDIVMDYIEVKDAALTSLKEYFEESHAERIKYPEYAEFHMYRVVVLALGEAVTE